MATNDTKDTKDKLSCRLQIACKYVRNALQEYCDSKNVLQLKFVLWKAKISVQSPN